jgi:hypothetical protein
VVVIVMDYKQIVIRSMMGGDRLDGWVVVVVWMVAIIIICSPSEYFEGRKIIWERLFEALFKRSSPKSSTHTLEKDLEKTFPNVCSIAQNLRLGSI